MATGLVVSFVFLASSCGGGDAAHQKSSRTGSEPERGTLQIVAMGPPGAGKGTQAEKISEKYGIPHISTGAILRTEVAKGTGLGREVKSIIERGELVADGMMRELVENRLKETDCEDGFILDGYPRTVQQTRDLEAILARRGSMSLKVINLDVPDEELVRRLLARRRADDKESTIKNRIRVYYEETSPLIEYYEKKGVLIRIDGDQPVERVFEDIDSVLSSS